MRTLAVMLGVVLSWAHAAVAASELPVVRAEAPLAQQLWTAPSEGGASCADCHDTLASLEGVAASLPRWNPNSERLENLEMRVNECRGERQQEAPWAWESEPMLALTAAIADASEGLPIEIETEGPARAALDAGRREYHRRRGQFDLSCAHCHDSFPTRRFRGRVPGPPDITRYPAGRDGWAGLGSRHRMIQWCTEAIRAQPWASGADEYLALEYFLTWRAAGTPLRRDTHPSEP